MKAAFLDLDETVTPEGVNSWEVTTEAVEGSVEDLYATLYQLRAGEITVPKALDLVYANWTSAGLATEEHLRDAFSNVPLREEAVGFIEQLRRQNYEPVLITGSMNLFAEVIAGRLGVRQFYYNSTLDFDRDGNLASLTYSPLQDILKHRQAVGFLEQQELAASEAIAVGDSENDQKLFQLVGTSFAIGSKATETLRATHYVQNLSDILPILANSALSGRFVNDA